MQKVYSSVLDDDTIKKLNALSKAKFGKDRKVSNFLRDMVSLLYDGCVLISKSGSVTVVAGDPEEYEHIVKQEQSVSNVCVDVAFGDGIHIENFIVKYKNTPQHLIE